MSGSSRYGFLKRVVVIAIILALNAPTVLLRPDAVFAATKTPSKPVITYCSSKDATVTIKWDKSKNAKTYRVYVQTGASKWKYWKKVKKSSKNKRKYSNTLKYKLVKSGEKYKVYRQQNPFKIAAKALKKRTCTFKGTYSKTYRFAVRSFNGKKYSKVSAVKTIKTKKEPASPTQPIEPDEPVQDDGILSATIDPDKKLVISVTAKEIDAGTLRIGLSPAYAEVPTHFMNIAKLEKQKGSNNKWTVVTENSLLMKPAFR